MVYCFVAACALAAANKVCNTIKELADKGVTLDLNVSWSKYLSAEIKATKLNNEEDNK